MGPFDLGISANGDVATLQLRGELDATAAPSLRDTIVGLVSEGRSTIIFDCAALEFVDSTGLGVLIGARARALAANGTVCLRSVRPPLQRLLAVSGIEGLFDIEPLEPASA